MDHPPARRPHPAIVIWAVVGILALLGRAVWTLLPRALEPWLDGSLDAWQKAAAAAWTAFMLYSEGYRGFQKAFSPRVIVRALNLADRPRWYFVLVAPAYAMALVHARPRRLAVSWCICAGIVLLVVLVARVAQPWRGIIDTGVVAGLAWGIVSLVWLAIAAARGRRPDADPDLPLRP